MYTAVLDHFIHVYMTGRLHVYGGFRSLNSCIYAWGTTCIWLF